MGHPTNSPGCQACAKCCAWGWTTPEPAQNTLLFPTAGSRWLSGPRCPTPSEARFNIRTTPEGPLPTRHRAQPRGATEPTEQAPLPKCFSPAPPSSSSKTLPLHIDCSREIALVTSGKHSPLCVPITSLNSLPSHNRCSPYAEWAASSARSRHLRGSQGHQALGLPPWSDRRLRPFPCCPGGGDESS